MSDLHLSLMAIGALVIAGVILYNWVQERRFRKLAQQRFEAPREDVLMETVPAVGEDVRIEPRLGDAPTAEGPEAAPVADAPASSAPVAPAALDAAIDYVARLDCAEAVSAARVRAVLAALDGGRARWFGLNRDDVWVDVGRAAEAETFSVLCGGIQLADRAGALTRDQLDAFASPAQALADQLMAVIDLPDRHAAAARAAELDSFCADVDILVGVNVVALEQQSFPGTKLRALAEAAGLQLAADGTYQLRDEQGRVVFSLTNQESAPFRADTLKQLSTHGVTLLLDVPNVRQGLRAFDQLIAFARQLADALKGMLVDDNLRPLTAEGIAKIKQQLTLIYAKMDQHGVPAGSARAHRLFS